MSQENFEGSKMNPDDQLYVDKKIAEFEAQMLLASKPPWGVLVALLGVLLAVISGAYTIVVVPMHERMSKLEINLEKYAQDTLREHKEIFRQWQDTPKR